ncbi:MAG: sigma factor-like helix-turn-helix DNA-binding protein [Bacilli bacterium]|nr:sigma factor-like helix-turn-helix DNA-binding protein [Bacilli bacterium]
MDKLERFGEQISSYDKLTVQEAKDLYKKAISISDKELQKGYIDEVVLGSLHYVYGYIKRYGLAIFECGSYDIDDIINSFVEVWIKRIKDGELLGANNYSDILNFTFIREACSKLIDEGNVFYDYIGMHRDVFWNLLDEFIKLKNSGKDFNFNKDITTSFTGFDSEFVDEELFYNIYDNLKFDKNDDLVMTKWRIKAFLFLFVYSGLYESLSEEHSIYNMEDEILKNKMNELFMDEVRRYLKDDKEIDTISRRYGFYSKKDTLESIGKDYDCSRESIRCLEKTALRKFRRSRKIRELKKDLFDIFNNK